MTEPKDMIDAALAEILRLKAELAVAQEVAESELGAVRAKHHAIIVPLDNEIGRLDKQVKTLARKHHKAVYGDRDQVSLDHGELLYAESNPVVRARTVTPDLLEALSDGRGLPAVKVVKSVDWAEIETWPEERLIEIGTGRKVKRSYNYELKEGRK